jgi:hypothetical protein
MTCPEWCTACEVIDGDGGEHVQPLLTVDTDVRGPLHIAKVQFVERLEPIPGGVQVRFSFRDSEPCACNDDPDDFRIELTLLPQIIAAFGGAA